MTTPPVDPQDMVPIATAATVAALGYAVTDEQCLRASVRIRAYSGQQITPGESTAILEGEGPWLMPQRPVRRILTIEGEPFAEPAARVNTARDLAGATWVNGPASARAWSAQRSGLVGQFLFWPGYDLTVTYEHGFDPIPATLVDLVGTVARRLSGMPDALIDGVHQESTGSESVGYGSWSVVGVSGLTPPEQAVVDRLFTARLPRTTRTVPA